MSHPEGSGEDRREGWKLGGWMRRGQAAAAAAASASRRYPGDSD